MRRIREELVSTFLYRLPEYKEKLQAFHSWDNSLIKNKLEELLENDCSLAIDYYRKRAG